MNLEQLIDQFELVTDTEEGIEQLRKVILHQAVHGNLSRNTSKNDMADELLKTIKTEKRRQKDEGLITRIPKVDHQEEWAKINSDYPDGWLITKLGNVLNLEYGKGLPTKKRNSNGSYPVFGSNGPMDNHDDYLVEGPCLVIGRKGSAGAINLTNENCWPTDVTYFVKPTESVDIKFSYYLLESLDLEELSKGIKPGLNRNEAYELMVGIPPIENQKKIVQKIESLFVQVDELEQKVRQDRQIDERLQIAVLHDLQRTETPEASRRSWQRLTDHFEQIYRKPEHIDQLKQAILNEAVRGRLVPQEPSGEPAEKLLERIKAEKQRLYEEGEIRKPKDLDPITKVDVPYDLPEGWKWEKFGNLGVINPRNDVDERKEASFIPMKMISENFISKHDHEIKKWKEIKSGYTHFAEGDIGLAKITPCFENGKAAIFKNLKNGIGAGTTELYIFRPVKGTILNKYAYLFLQTPRFREEGKNKMTGTAGQQRVPKSYFEEVLFPLPPLEEQKRIIEKIGELFTSCDDLKSTLSWSRQTDQRLLEALVKE